MITLPKATRKKMFHKGITLIEVLTAISIFAIVITAAINLFASLIKYQNIALGKAYLFNTTSFTIDYISRTIRMAQKDTNGACITSGYNFISQTPSSLKFLNADNECTEIFLENGIVKIRKLNITQNLTPANIKVDILRFALAGADQNDTIQPKVSFSLKASTLSAPAQSITVQTTVSQRMLDIVY